MILCRSALAFFLIAWVLVSPCAAQPESNSKLGRPDRFRQLDEWLPTPNLYRTASGAPGPQYWQQRADYEIEVRLDDEDQTITGRERVSYHNHSPLALESVWFQLDQNIFRPDSDDVRTATAPDFSSPLDVAHLRSLLARQAFEGGYNLTRVAGVDGQELQYTVVKTMMRVDLPEPLRPGQSTQFELEWNYKINDSKLIWARTGYEFFETDGNYIYEIAHWYPRVAAYTDYTGWQHKQFLGRGEFTLELGDFDVSITVPADHLVAATGVLTNPEEVLSDVQRQRLEQARTAEKPVFIVTPEEAKENQREAAEGEKTWRYSAQNVRDFAFASSRKFIVDAQGHEVDGNPVLASSYYPNEAEPLWSKYSTASIIHTLDVYSRYTFAYPYPVAISVNGPVYGMEYPMICFNGPRPEEDGTYSERTKYGLISVIIHEVGHNYFPMIVNSDERQWTWMDEGLNTFLQFLAEQEWEDEYPSRRGNPEDITGYMTSSEQVPIMTASDSILQFGNNGYGKPATALNILRETILGRELFDHAFRQYAQRWKFKRPTPADFFRSMEDAAGQDLDWFWRGWFYSTDHVDIAIEDVQRYRIESGDPEEAAERKRREREQERPTVTEERNREIPKRVDQYPGLKDFYNEYDDLRVTEQQRKAYQRFLERLDEEERQLLKRQTNFYVVSLRNVGGLVMPVILEVSYDDGSRETLRLPAHIWRRNPEQVEKLIITDKEVVRIELDPQGETADTDDSNNHFPPRIESSRFKLFKKEQESNPMREAAEEAKKKDAPEQPAQQDQPGEGEPPMDPAAAKAGEPPSKPDAAAEKDRAEKERAPVDGAAAKAKAETAGGTEATEGTEPADAPAAVEPSPEGA